MVKGVNPKGVWQPKGRGFAMATVSKNDGHIVHLTGQVAWDENENIIGVNDTQTQARQCFQNIKIILEALGGTMGDIISITTYLVERSDLPIVQNVRNEFLDNAHAPASTSIIVAGLGHENFKVELTPIAIIPKERFIEV